MNFPKLSGYIITAYDIKFYCKLAKINSDTPDYKCVISFGTGMKKFCMTASYEKKKPNEIYIDRVENNDLCIINGKLKNYDKGTIKLVKTGLYTLKMLFPDVSIFTLFDDSQIYCDEKSKLFKLSMSYDYILKYNETWYQKNFNAQLPGFISKKYLDKESENKSSNKVFPIIQSEPNSLMDIYSKSLDILDEPIMNYNLILNIFPQFSEFKAEYESAKTPREFINSLRRVLGDKYCFVVGKWLNQYMVNLRIKFTQDFWFIHVSNISTVPNFSMIEMDISNVKRVLNGGGSKTQKNKKNKFKMIADSNFTDSFVGVYGKD